jgi:ABC-type multidrug transport system fused ATPase/permease subunit
LKYSNIKKIIYLIPVNKKKEVLFLILFMFLGIILEMVGIGVIIPGLSMILNPGVYKSYPIAENGLKFIGNPSQSTLIFLVLSFFIIIYFIKFIFFIFLTWKQNNFSNAINLSISQELFKGYLASPYSFHLNKNSSQLLRIIQNDVGAFFGMMQAIIIIAIEMTMLIGISLVLLISEPFGTILIVSFFLIFGIIFQRLIKGKLLKFGKNKQYYGGLIYQSLLQGFGAVKDVKLLGREFFFENEFKKNNIIFTKNNIKINILNVLPRPYLEFISVVGLSIMILVLTKNGENLTTLVPILGVFLAASFRMIPSINRIMSSMQVIRVTKISIDTLYDELVQIRHTDTSQPVEVLINSGFKNKISIIDVSYKYPNTDKNILSKINLEIEFGKSIGIVGPSGSGKSTLVDLILGLLSPTKGMILVDDQNIQNNLREWQKNIGYVPQNIFLTDDSIKKNVAFGIPENEIDNNALWSALKSSQLNDYVLNLPDGVNTFVGERGVRLSGGQRQRIGIARALYHNPNVLVFDEATSALDSKTELDFMQAVDQLKGIKTLIIIAHRISTLSNCDKIISIKDEAVIFL